jgi:hypothetical protein
VVTAQPWSPRNHFRVVLQNEAARAKSSLPQLPQCNLSIRVVNGSLNSAADLHSDIGGVDYPQEVLLPHGRHVKHAPLRVQMAPQTWQLGASPMSTNSLCASAGWQ